jgi:sugar lactone lactonase YvrE
MSPPAFAQYVIGSSSSSFIYTVAGDGNPGYSGDGSQATSADMNSPASAVIDITGNLYIADTYNNVVRKVAAGTGVITTFAGNGTAGYTGDGGAATSAQLSSPWGLAVDGAGNLYIADTGNNRIRKVAAGTGIISTYAGNGTLTYSGDNGPAISAGISYFEGIALDASGNLYIAESGSEHIRKVAASTGTITTVAGNGQYGYTGDGGAATSAKLGSPTGVAIDIAGNLYIADSNNNVVRKVAVGTGIITTVAGNGTAGYIGDGGPATGAKLYRPFGVAVDGVGNLYIADSYNLVIRKLTTSDGTITTVAGDGNAPTCFSLGGDGGPATSAALCLPLSVSVDSTGNLYIADTSRNRIRLATVVNPAPTAATAAPTFTVSGGTYSGPQIVTITDSTPGAAIYLTMDGTSPFTFSPGYRGPVNVTGGVKISAIAVAPGYLTSTPSTATYTITSGANDVITTVAGDGVHGFSGVSGPATSAEFGTPQGTALDSAGNLYFSDTDNHVVWMLSAQTGNLSVVAGNGTPGYSGDGGPAGSAQLNYPLGIALDNAGNLYVADSANNVVRKIAASTGLITTAVGNGQTGSAGNKGDGGPATAARLYTPSSVGLDSNGNLYIADTNHNAVRRVSASTGIITTVAGTGSYGSGGDGGPATSATVYQPNAVALDSAGNLYIATPSFGRIRKVTAGNGVITTVAGNGNLYGNSGDGGAAINAEIYPQALAVDGAGNLYLSSSPFIRKVDATGLITTVVGSGYGSYGGDGGPATVAEISGPHGISFDAAGNLYIADSANPRIRKVSFMMAATPVFSVAAGSYSSSQTLMISDSTQSATIYYTTDGTTPTTNSTVYAGPITVSSSETIKAIAATGYTISGVATASYVINLPVTAAPTFSPAAGTYSSTQTVTISDATAGAIIYYTLNGSTPTASSSVYAGPITVSSTETIKAIATASGYETSTPTTATYTINIPANAVPILSSMSPAFTAVGSPAFTLTITGSGFTSGSTVYWGATALSTQVGSGTQLIAQVPASNAGVAGISAITVQTPGPGGGVSNLLQFEVDSASSGSVPPPSFSTPTATVASGSTVTYPVTLPSSATNVAVNCLNMPTGAICSYSALAGVLTITTSPTTPSGTYQITAVFTETLPGAATGFVLLPILLSPFVFVRRESTWRRTRCRVCFALLLLAASSGITACGGSGSSPTPPASPTHQVTTSAVLTLTIR